MTADNCLYETPKNSKIPSGQKIYRMNYIRLGRYRPTHKKQNGSKKSVQKDLIFSANIEYFLPSFL